GCGALPHHFVIKIKINKKKLEKKEKLVIIFNKVLFFFVENYIEDLDFFCGDIIDTRTRMFLSV
ncbi:MAG: hypothetical protein KAT05_04140, partial [Spirochaetes bacterium]|nr:hypothetical protein [Spirochaetota bacterium]